MSAPSLNVAYDGQSSTTADYLNTFEQTCDNYMQLRDLTGISGIQVFVRGTAAPNDGGQGVFYWSGSSSAPDDNYNVLRPLGSVLGAWIRVPLVLKQSFGGFPLAQPVRFITASTDVASASDWFLGWDFSFTGTKNQSIPGAGSVVKGTQIVIKDILGDAATNNIVISPASGTIGGAANFTINTNNGSVTFLSDGVSNWISLTNTALAGPAGPAGAAGPAGPASGAGYSNLVARVIGSTSLAITASAVTVSDTSGNSYLLTSYSQIINTGTVGANGLDTGTIAPNTWYAFYAIRNTTTGTSAALLSLYGSGPVLPTGYTASRRLGWVRTGASGLIFSIQNNADAQFIGGPLPLMASGAAGSNTVPTWAAVPVLAPVTAGKVKFVLVIANGTYAIVAPNNTYGATGSTTNPPPVQVTGYYSVSQVVEMVLESPNIYWANSTGTGSQLLALGWTDNL